MQPIDRRRPRAAGRPPWNPRHGGEFPRGGNARPGDQRCPGTTPSGASSPSPSAPSRRPPTSGSRKRDDQGLEAKGHTVPKPTDLEQEQEAAAEVLKAGAEHKPDAMERAAKKAPPR